MDVLLVLDSWIVGGDCNNLETPSKFRVDIPPYLSVETDAWDGFLFALRFICMA